MKRPIIATFAIALGFLSITMTEAKVFTWTDASGVKHYSSVPPRPKEKVSNLSDDLRITDNKSAAPKEKEADKKDSAEKKTDANKKANNKTKKLPLNQAEVKQHYCDNQQKNLMLLTQNTSVKWIEKGKETKLTDKQRKEKIRSIHKNIAEDCSEKSAPNSE